MKTILLAVITASAVLLIGCATQNHEPSMRHGMSMMSDGKGMTCGMMAKADSSSMKCKMCGQDTSASNHPEGAGAHQH